jgi:hypothetical protein
MVRPFTDITSAIAENPVKNGTILVNGYSIPDCYNISSSNIHILMNGNYTDLEEEAPNLVAAIASFGNSYSTFENISESTFASLSGGILVIPELDNADTTLENDLTSGAKNAIATFVNDGGTLITFEPDSDNLYSLLNSIFGFSLDTGGISEPVNLTAEGLALFPTAPSGIPDNDGTDSLDTSTLPPSSVTIYEGDGANQSVVTMMPYGDGKIYVMGWDWYDGSPLGEQDGGWLEILDLIISSSLSLPCDSPMSCGITYNRYVQEYPSISGIQSKYGNRFYNGIFVTLTGDQTIVGG